MTVVLPDAEWLAVQVLREALDGVSVGVEFQGEVPAVVVSRVGGVADTHGIIDRPRLDVEVRAATKEAAHDLGQQARAAMWAAAGSSRSGVTIGRCREFLGLSYAPDADVDGAPRYMFTVEWTVK